MPSRLIVIGILVESNIEREKELNVQPLNSRKDTHFTCNIHQIYFNVPRKLSAVIIQFFSRNHNFQFIQNIIPAILEHSSLYHISPV